MNKHDQRTICRNNLFSLTAKQIKEYSSIICKKLIPFLNKTIILSYYPTNNEVDISCINKNVYYPVIIDEHFMEAYKPSTNTFIKNKYGIYEPDTRTSTFINPENTEIVIVPLLGFDKRCNRLGHGQGYYDNYLKRCSNALKIGIGFEAQKLDKVIVDNNDIQLDYIISEKNIYKSN